MTVTSRTVPLFAVGAIADIAGHHRRPRVRISMSQVIATSSVPVGAEGILSSSNKNVIVLAPLLRNKASPSCSGPSFFISGPFR